MSMLWPLIFAWCLLLGMLDWSKFDLSDPGWAAVCLTLVSAVCVAVYKVIPSIYKNTAYKHHNFKINILNRLPISSQHPSPIIAEAQSVKILGMGAQRLFVELKATCKYKPGFPVKHINFRFLKGDEVCTGVPVKSAIPIEAVTDPVNSAIFHPSDDNYNGIDGEYADIRGLGENGCLYFELVIKPTAEWNGYLSFKAKDSTGFCSFVRHAIEVQSFPAPHDDELEERDMEHGFRTEQLEC